MRDRESHCRHALGRRIDQSHRIFFPCLAGRLVSHASPKVNHLLTLLIHTARGAQLAPPREIFDERISYRFITGAHKSVNVNTTMKFIGQPVPYLLNRDVSRDRKSTRLNSSHGYISYAVFCLKKKK